MAETNLKTVPRGAPPSRRDTPPPEPIDPGKALEEHFSFTDKDLYSVGQGKKQPSARLVREWARRAGLSAEILEWGKDAEKAWAKVRAWKGPKDAPEAEESAVVCHLYKDLFLASVFEALSNGLFVQSGQFYESGKPILRRHMPKWEMGEDGWPVLTESFAQGQLLKNFFERKRFAERDALTKAERIAFLKLLGKDPEEHEDDEDVGDKEKGQKAAAEPPPKPQTLPELGKAIFTALMTLCDQDRGKAEEELRRVSEVKGEFPFPAVSRLSEIKHLDHAREILSRVEAFNLQKQRQEKAEQNAQERATADATLEDDPDDLG